MESKIPLKTDSYFDPHDFIQTECGTMKELLVTITLAEYRALVETNARLYAHNAALEADLKAARGELWTKEDANAAG